MTVNEIEDRGYWWLPEDPDGRLPGTLTLSTEQRPTLHLLGAFTHLAEIGNPRHYPIIQGIGESGEGYTLVGCSGREITFRLFPAEGTPDLNAEEFSIDYVYKGWRFEDPSQIRFSEVCCSLAHLEDWLNISAFSLRYELDPENNAPRNISYHLTNPRTRTFSFRDFVIEIIPSYSIPAPRFTKGIQSTISWSLRLRYSNEQTPDKMLSDITRVRNLIALGLRKSIQHLSITFTLPRPIEEIDSTNYPVAIAFYSGRMQPSEQLSDAIRLDEMLFSFADVEPIFPTVLEKWFDMYEQVTPTLELYFSTLYQDRTSLISSFLQVRQAIETYHRRMRGGRYLSEEDDLRVQDRLKSAIPTDLTREIKETFAKKISYINEFSLRRRLKDLMRSIRAQCGDDFLRFIGDSSTFIDAAADSRNYYTHYEESLRGSAKRGIGLLLLTDRGRFLLDLLFLIDLGFTAEMVHRLLNETTAYSFLLDYRQWNPEVPDNEW